MRIKHVKILKSGDLSINHCELIEVEGQLKDDKSGTRTYRAKPMESFYAALKELAGLLVTENRLANTLVNEVRVTGVIFKYTGKESIICRAQVIGTLPSKHAKEPIKLNGMPFRVMESDTDPQGEESLEDKWVTRLDTVRQEVEAFLAGNVAQPELGVNNEGEAA